jgi:sulfoxide reductase catalytic subunit YedY
MPRLQITDEAVYLSRRQFVRRLGAMTAAGAAGPLALRAAAADRLPAVRNGALSVAEAPTPREIATAAVRYAEFSADRDEAILLSRDRELRPWTLVVDGEVHKPRRFDVDELLRRFPLEERVYRFRCVEGWSMVVPWSGIPLARLLEQVSPTGQARFVMFSADPPPDTDGAAPDRGFEWPYTEGLRLDEAMHPLTLLAAGIYGRVLPAQNGAPLRLVVPWKYGFKSCKAVVRIRLVRRQPRTSWPSALPREYGFYANVNPTVAHPRWSQATERDLGAGGAYQRTMLFNGYAEQVAKLYATQDLTVDF